MNIIRLSKKLNNLKIKSDDLLVIYKDGIYYYKDRIIKNYFLFLKDLEDKLDSYQIVESKKKSRIYEFLSFDEFEIVSLYFDLIPISELLILKNLKCKLSIQISKKKTIYNIFNKRKIINKIILRKKYLKIYIDKGKNDLINYLIDKNVAIPLLKKGKNHYKLYNISSLKELIYED